MASAAARVQSSSMPTTAVPPRSTCAGSRALIEA